MKEKNLIFMMCLPRSGSTLTQKLLNNHSEIYSKSEPWILFNSANYLTDDNIIANYDSNIAKIGSDNFIENMPINNPMNFFKKKLRKLHLKCYSKYLQKEKKTYFIDKTTRYLYIYKQIDEIFPKSKKILIIRNPISILSSIFTTWSQDNISLINNSKYDFFKMIDKIIEIKNNKDKKYIIVHYEDLLKNPKLEISKICHHIGLNFEKQMLNYVKSETVVAFTDPNIYKHEKIESNNNFKNINNLKTLQEWQYLYDYLKWIGKERFKELGYSYSETKRILLKKRKTLHVNKEETLHLEDIIDINKDFFQEHRSLASISKFMNSQDTAKSFNFSVQFNKFFNFLMKLNKSNKSYLIYGAGTVGQVVYNLIEKKVVTSVDKKSSLMNKDIKKNKIYTPKNIKNIKFDKIIITVLGRETKIIKDLTSNFGIPRDKIITVKF